jgi:hypothetical protein
MDVQTSLGVFALVTICLCFMVVLPILLAFRESRRKLELDHAARIKAIELGRPLPSRDTSEDEPWTMAARLATGIGVVVPLGSLACALVASLALGFHQEMWIAGGMVALGGVICGGSLAGYIFSPDKGSSERVERKPYVEEDAFDVVGARG